MKRGRKKGDNAARDAELIRFYLEGHALRQTGARYSITYERVRQILNKTGIKPRKSSPSVKQFKPRKTQTSQERFWSLVDRSACGSSFILVPIAKTRTRNIRFTGAALYHLSYTGACKLSGEVVFSFRCPLSSRIKASPYWRKR